MLHPCSGYFWGAVSVFLYVFTNYRVLSLVYRLFGWVARCIIKCSIRAGGARNFWGKVFGLFPLGGCVGCFGMSFYQKYLR